MAELFSTEEYDNPLTESDIYRSSKKPGGKKSALEPVGRYDLRTMASAQKSRCHHEKQITLDGELCWECGLAWPLTESYDSPARKPAPAAPVSLSDPLPTCGPVTVHNLLTEPALLLTGSGATYIGRKNTFYKLKASPLANASEIKDKKSQAARDVACSDHIRVLIRALEVQSGPTWNELRKLAMQAREGQPVKLMCYCHPKRCHGHAIALVVEGLAKRTPVTTLIQNLEQLLAAGDLVAGRQGLLLA